MHEFSFRRRASFLDQRNPADRALTGFVGMYLWMDSAGVIEVLRIRLRRLLFHFFRGLLHLLGRFLHLISDGLFLGFNVRRGTHSLMIFHFHLAMLHSWHVAVIHVLYTLSTFRHARGLTQFALDRDCCFVV